MTDQETGDDAFASIVAGDLAQRRRDLDALDLPAYADRCTLLVLAPDGSVDGTVVLAGPDGPVAHGRQLDEATIDKLARHQPDRWRDPQCLRTDAWPAEPAARLLAAWAPTETITAESVPWAALLVCNPSDRP